MREDLIAAGKAQCSPLHLTAKQLTLLAPEKLISFPALLTPYHHPNTISHPSPPTVVGINLTLMAYFVSKLV